MLSRSPSPNPRRAARPNPTLTLAPAPTLALLPALTLRLSLSLSLTLSPRRGSGHSRSSSTGSRSDATWSPGSRGAFQAAQQEARRLRDEALRQSAGAQLAARQAARAAQSEARRACAVGTGGVTSGPSPGSPPRALPPAPLGPHHRRPPPPLLPTGREALAAAEAADFEAAEAEAEAETMRQASAIRATAARYQAP